MSKARLALSVVGLLLAVAGVLLEQRVLVWVAIGLIGTSILLRMIGRRSR